MVDFTIGELSKKAGISSQTIRYYERQGLIGPKYRTDSGYRVYSDDSMRRLTFIKNAKEVGFTLREIKAILDENPETMEGVTQIRGITQEKLREVQDKIEELQRIEKELNSMVETCKEGCQSNQESPYCSIVSMLEK